MAANKELKERWDKILKQDEKLWYTYHHLQSISDIYMYRYLLGSRNIGKSYSISEYFTQYYKKYHVPFIWIRLTDTQAKKLLQNNAVGLVDPDLQRKYDLDLITNANYVYNVLERDDKGKIKKKELFARVFAASNFYINKGSNFDKDFLSMSPHNKYLIGIDEFERESGEKNTYDLVYCLTNQIHNLIRDTKFRTEIYFIGNTLERASDVLAALNFIPETFGTYHLIKNKKLLQNYKKEYLAATTDKERNEIDKKYSKVDFGKRTYIEYIDPSDVSKARAHGSVQDVFGSSMSTFTNKIDQDTSLLDSRRLLRPNYVIVFNKDKKFTVWDNGIIKQYNKENVRQVPMRPYLDLQFNKEWVDTIMSLYDTRSFRFYNRISKATFDAEMIKLKPRGTK